MCACQMAATSLCEACGWTIASAPTPFPSASPQSLVSGLVHCALTLQTQIQLAAHPTAVPIPASLLMNLARRLRSSTSDFSSMLLASPSPAGGGHLTLADMRLSDAACVNVRRSPGIQAVQELMAFTIKKQQLGKVVSDRCGSLGACWPEY
jgi:hypothetical protein